MEWMLMPLQRYADFNGRSRRREFWMFFLGLLILYAVVGVLVALLGGYSGGTNGFAGISMMGLVLFCVVALALFIPSLAVYIRRFHDQDRTGWWVLLMFVPYIGGLILLVFMCIEGTRGENRFGPDPKGAVAAY